MDQRIVRPRIDDVAREAGVSKTAVSFAFNSPERLAPETADRIRARRRAARLHAAPGGPDAHPARDADDRRAHAAGAVGRLREPVLRGVRGGGRGGRRGVAAMRSSSSRRCAGRSPARWTARRSTAWSPSACRGDHPEVERDPARRRPDRPRRLDRPPRPRARSTVDDVGGARAAAEHLLELGHRDVLVIGVEPPAPVDRPRPERRHRPAPGGYREAFAAAGIELADERVVARPGHASTAGVARSIGLGGRPAPTAILAMSDALAIGAIARPARPRPARPAATSASSASMTSTSPRTSTRR